jgi:hypothetical protein
MIYAYPEKLEQFKVLSSEVDVAQFLKISLYDLDQVLINPSYNTFEIQKKSGGIRTITAPNHCLKRIQQKLLDQLNQLYEKPSSVLVLLRWMILKKLLVPLLLMHQTT